LKASLKEEICLDGIKKKRHTNVRYAETALFHHLHFDCVMHLLLFLPAQGQKLYICNS